LIQWSPRVTRATPQFSNSAHGVSHVWLIDPTAKTLEVPAVRRRIGLGVLLFTLAIALLVTLYPFQFRLGTARLSRIEGPENRLRSPR
jgi:hypothetical protein